MMNRQLKKRGILLCSDPPLTMFGPLIVDAFHTTSYIPNKVEIRITMRKARPEFSLMSLVGYDMTRSLAIRVDLAELWVKKITPSRAVLSGIETRLAHSATRIPMLKMVTRYFTHTPNVTSFNHMVYDGERCPRRLFVMIIPEDAYYGSYFSNPFLYKYSDVREIQIQHNGVNVPSQPLRLGLQHQEYLAAYMFFMLNLGPNMRIEPGEFMLNNAIFAFNLSPATGATRYAPERGYVQLNMQFRPAPKYPLSVLCIGEFDHTLRIDKDRNVAVE